MGGEWRPLPPVACSCASGATYLGLQQGGSSGDIASIVAGHQRALLRVAAVRCVASSDRQHRQASGVRTASWRFLRWYAGSSGDEPQLAGGRADGGRRKGCSPPAVLASGARMSSVSWRFPSPEVALTVPPTRTTRDGYSVLAWPGADSGISAVFDVADAELGDFARQLAKRHQRSSRASASGMRSRPRPRDRAKNHDNVFPDPAPVIHAAQRPLFCFASLAPGIASLAPLRDLSYPADFTSRRSPPTRTTHPRPRRR